MINSYLKDFTEIRKKLTEISENLYEVSIEALEFKIQSYKISKNKDKIIEILNLNKNESLVLLDNLFDIMEKKIFDNIVTFINIITACDFNNISDISDISKYSLEINELIESNNELIVKSDSLLFESVSLINKRKDDFLDIEINATIDFLNSKNQAENTKSPFKIEVQKGALIY